MGKVDGGVLHKTMGKVDGGGLHTIMGKVDGGGINWSLVTSLPVTRRK